MVERQFLWAYGSDETGWYVVTAALYALGQPKKFRVDSEETARAISSEHNADVLELIETQRLA